MAQFPSPGGSIDTWGTELIEALLVSHNMDGTLKKDDYTKLLIHFDGVDGSKANYTAETGQIVSMGTALGNDAQLDTAQNKFGSASLLLDGTTDYVTVPASEDWNFGTGDFTIDCWVRWNVLPSSGSWSMIFSQYVDTTHYSHLGLTNNAGVYTLNFTEVRDGSWIINKIITPVINRWYHIAVIRYGSIGKIYFDGVGGDSTDLTGATFSNLAVVPQIGAWSTILVFNGWIDEFRISKGIARWTANFTPPSLPYVLIK